MRGWGAGGETLEQGSADEADVRQVWEMRRRETEHRTQVSRK